MRRRRPLWSDNRRPDWIRRLIVSAGIACLAFAAWLFYGDWRFARDGRPVRGIVDSREVKAHGTGVSRTKRYVVRYRYTLDGRVFEGEDTVTRGSFDPLQEGEPVDVVYRPDAPGRSRLRGHTAWFVKFWTIVFGSICLLTGARSGRSRRRRQA